MGIVFEGRTLLVDGKEMRLFGAQVDYYRLAVKYWESVLKSLIDAGFSLVTIYIPWRLYAPVRGQDDFSGKNDERLNLIRFLELCGKLNVKVFFRPGPLIINEMDCGGLPDYVTSDPNLCVWDAENKIPEGFGMRGQKKGAVPSYLHPTYLGYVREWLTTVNSTVKDFFYSRGGPIIMVQLDNEISMVCKDRMFGSDYNPFVVGKDGLYHRWLREKYKDIKNLPYAGKYSDFNEVESPRKLDRESPDLLYYFDWIAFKEWTMAEYIRKLRNIHEECGLGEVIYCTNFNAHRPETIPNNWKLFEEATGGICGSDFYRRPWMDYDGYYRMVTTIKLSDAIMKFPWSPEMMAGYWGREKDKITDAIPAEHTEFMSLLSLAHGLKGLNYCYFTDREYWFNAPLSELGHKRSVYYALQKVTNFANNIKHLGELKRVSEIAVLFYRPYGWFCHLEDPMPGDESKVHIGELKIDGIRSGEIYLEFEGMIRLISQAGYDPSIVDPYVYPERINDYRVVFAPAQSFMDEGTQRLLLDYVKAGGNLIIGPSIPDKDLGLKPLRIIKENISPGEKILEGESGISQYSYGKGRIIHLNRFIAQGAAGEESEENIRLVKFLLQEYLKVIPPFSVEEKFIDLVVQKEGKEAYLFVVNIGERPVEVNLKSNDSSVEKLIEYYGKEKFPLRDDSVSFTIDSKSVLIFEVIKS